MYTYYFSWIRCSHLFDIIIILTLTAFCCSVKYAANQASCHVLNILFTNISLFMLYTFTWIVYKVIVKRKFTKNENISDVNSTTTIVCSFVRSIIARKTFRSWIFIWTRWKKRRKNAWHRFYYENELRCIF